MESINRWKEFSKEELSILLNNLYEKVDKSIFEQVLKGTTFHDKYKNIIRNEIKRKKYKEKKRKKKNSDRPFDVDKYRKRFIVFKLFYYGEIHDGFASQDNTDNTIESYLFEALKKTKLIDSVQDIDSFKYSRCGRTDKGVSSFGQTITVLVRSNIPSNAKAIYKLSNNSESKSKWIEIHELDDCYPNDQIKILSFDDNTMKHIKEIEYCTVLNSVLPSTIYIYGWAPAPLHFNARFSTLYRTYRYFFFKKNLNLEKMKEAGEKLIGVHDYRNFCRNDPNVLSSIRHIFQFKIFEWKDTINRTKEYQMYYMEISGGAFLWHQVRNMASILFIIGEGKEKPEIIDYLLNINPIIEKPQYNMASALPLVLQDCIYENIHFEYELNVFSRIDSYLEKTYEHVSIQQILIANKIKSMNEINITISNEEKFKYKLNKNKIKWKVLKEIIQQNEKKRTYRSMMGRCNTSLKVFNLDENIK